MFKGLMHKPYILKVCEGRQEQGGKKMTPKTKGNKESNNYCKNVETTEKLIYIFFAMGEVQLGQMLTVKCSHVYY